MSRPLRILLVTDSAAIHSIVADSPVVIRDEDDGIDVVPISALCYAPHDVVINDDQVAVMDADRNYQIYAGYDHQAEKEIWHDVLHTSMHHYVGEILRVYTPSSMVDATPNHSMLTKDFREIEPEYAFGSQAVLHVTPLKVDAPGTDDDLWVNNENNAFKMGQALFDFPDIFGEFQEAYDAGHYNDGDVQVASWMYRSSWNDRLSLPREVFNSKSRIWMRIIAGYRKASGNDVTLCARNQLIMQQLLVLMSGGAGIVYTVEPATRTDYAVTFGDIAWSASKDGIGQIATRLDSYQYDGYVYDMECDDGRDTGDRGHSFTTGIGACRVHNSGLGKVAKEIFERVNADEKFHVEMIGFGHQNASEQVSFRIHAPSPHPKDKHGAMLLQKMLPAYKPDIVFTNHDAWNLPHLCEARFLGGFQLVWQPFVESAPLRHKLAAIWNAADMIVPPTDYARRAILALPDIQKNKVLDPVLCGVNRKIFRPMTDKERAAFRTNFLLKTREFARLKNPFVIGFNGRNFFRKMNYALFHLAAILSGKHYHHCRACRSVVSQHYDWEFCKWSDRIVCPECKASRLEGPQETDPDFGFWFHTPQNDQGWRLPHLVRMYDLHGRILMTDNYQVAKGMKEDQLPSFYNSLDCYVSFASEGFGLPHCEAMACGIPVIAPDSSGGAEITRELGLNWEVKEFIIDEGLSCARALPNYTAVLTNIWKVYYNSQTRRSYHIKALEMAKRYDWDSIAEEWKKILNVQTLPNGVISI